MIHETSFCNDMQEYAFLIRHCTLKDTIEVGIKSNCEYTLMTHFSPRIY